MIEPLQLNIPDVLETERLLLRVPNVEDGPLVNGVVQTSLPELSAWLPWAKPGYGLTEASTWCRRSAAKFMLREEAPYLIFDRSTLRLLGAVSLYAQDWKTQRCELGYWLATSECGRGVMTEAVVLITAVGFDSFQAFRMQIRADARNKRSQNVALRAGYQMEGILRKFARDNDGQHCDMCMFARVR